MKKAKYRVFEKLRQLLDDKSAVTTKEVAKAMNLSRGVTSSYLAQLYHEGLLLKKGTKPVYWQLISNSQDAFAQLIGANGSLKNIVSQCKASVNYPSSGFPLIITGPSGSGKSYLASLIFKYAQQEGVINKGAHFVVLNCADYANNPELLSSVLFGYKKGTFTGADADKTGLVDQADNGYLFLDEVHRLPRESQEKLFVLLDSGKFYPLGENKHFKQVNVRFIFATTEKIEDKLLNTFLRRVPLKIALPGFSERPLIEKYQLIEFFLKHEANRINRTIKISFNTIQVLVNQKQEGNIGSLANKIKLLCAENFNSSDKKAIEIPNNKNISGPNVDWLVFKPNSQDLLVNLAKENSKKYLSTLLSTLYDNENKNQEISEQNLVLNQFVHDIKRNSVLLIYDQNFEKFLMQQLATATEKIGKKYGILKYLNSQKLCEAVKVLSVIQECPDLPDISNLLTLVSKHYPRTVYLCKQIRSCFKVDINNDWFIPIFLYAVFDEIAGKIESQNLLAIMVCHGGNVASDICAIVNELCGNYIFEAFDMPLNVSNHEIAQKIELYIRKQGRKYDGTILLFDMGSLSNLYKEVKVLLNNDLLVINNLTTEIALDLGLQIQQNKSFKKIAEKAESYPSTMSVKYFEGISQKANIIVSCMSGEGLAEEIKRILQKVLQTDVEIITMDYHELKTTLQRHDLSYFKNTNFILTTNNVDHQKELDVLNLYDIMDEDGDKRLRQLLKEMGETKKNVDKLTSELLKFFTIGGIKGRLRFLNPDVVIPEIQEIVAKFENYYHVALTNKFKLSLCMHLALMLERLMLDQTSDQESKDTQEKSKEEKDFYHVADKIFHNIEQKYNIKINDYELSLIYELFKTNSE